MTAKTRIVVIGGGFAGLESAFLAHAKLGDRADITLVSDQRCWPGSSEMFASCPSACKAASATRGKLRTPS